MFFVFLLIAVSAVSVIPRPGSTTFFEGTVRISDVDYTMSCECTADLNATQGTTVPGLDFRVAVCRPKTSTVHLEYRPSGGSDDSLTPPEIESAYGQARHTMMTDVSRTPFMCADDRGNYAALHTPGGEFGEFLLGLTTWESLQHESTISIDTVISLLANYTLSLPVPLTLCTDDQAISQIEAEVGLTGLDLDSIVDGNIQNSVLVALGRERNQGDLLLKSLAANPAKYLISRELLSLALQAVMRLKWGAAGDDVASRIQLIVHAGTSNPRAVLDVREGDGCTRQGLGAMIRPRVAEVGGSYSQAYVVNGAAVSIRRQKHVAPFFTREVADNQDMIQIFSQRLDAHGAAWWDALFSVRFFEELRIPLYILELVG